MNGAEEFFGDVSQYAVGTYLIMRGYLEEGEPYVYDYTYVASEVVDGILDTSDMNLSQQPFYTDKSKLYCRPYHSR